MTERLYAHPPVPAAALILVAVHVAAGALIGVVAWVVGRWV